MLPPEEERQVEIDLATKAIRDLPLGSLYKLRDYIDFLIFCDGTVEIPQAEDTLSAMEAEEQDLLLSQEN